MNRAMISKETLKKTMICYWSGEMESFIAESPMMPDVIFGVGDDANEAIATFLSALESNYDEIAADNVAGYTKGRPAKGYVPFNANIRPSSKNSISELATNLGIAQGEAVDYLVFFYEHKSQEKSFSRSAVAPDPDFTIYGCLSSGKPTMIYSELAQDSWFNCLKQGEPIWWTSEPSWSNWFSGNQLAFNEWTPIHAEQKTDDVVTVSNVVSMESKRLKPQNAVMS